jgi:hypothetical protein
MRKIGIIIKFLPMANISTHKIHKVLALVLNVLFLAVLPSTVLAQTAQEIARKAFGSTVLLVMEDAKGQPLSLGSGFFVRDGEVASNLHVVEGAARGYAKIIGQKAKYDIEGITAVDPDRDLVVLKISGARAGALAFGNSESVQVGETVYAVGNPQGLEGTFSQGIVSSIREVGTDKILQITAPISPGSSGGPVLNGRGEVIGVSVATFRGGQNLNFAIPSSYLKTLLGKAGPVKSLAQAKPPKAQRSILADLGGRSSEGVVGEKFLWDHDFFGGYPGEYSFSLRNKLRSSVRSVHCLVVFYDGSGDPVDADVVHYRETIPPGLARRVPGQVHLSTQKLTTREGSKTPSTKVEFRILNFEIID